MTAQIEALPAQTSCDLVRREFGTPPDVELMTDPNFQEAATDVATSLEAAHAYLDVGEERGRAAQKALTDLGCVACGLESLCSVNEVLNKRVEIGRANSELRRQTTMLETAPAWLKVARLNQPSIGPEIMQKIRNAAGDTHKTDALLKSGELDLDQLLADVTNGPAGLYAKAELPELQRVSNVDPNTTIEGHAITTQNGDKFIVLDATNAVGFRGHGPSRADYAVLVSKLLGRMKAHDAQGKPQILSADGKMQKPIYDLNGVPVFELRMNGKNRMYLAINSSNAQEPTRITILGSHGGDADTQRAFLDVALAE